MTCNVCITKVDQDRSELKSLKGRERLPANGRGQLTESSRDTRSKFLPGNRLGGDSPAGAERLSFMQSSP